jgi:lysophospholipid acyltransferase (LPLAT)-like uncharacterized protein
VAKSNSAPAKITPLQGIAAFVGGLLLKTLARTLRVEWKDEAGFYSPARQRPVILCIWHNRLLGAVLCDHRAAKRRRVPLSVLTSASKDGGWLAAIAKKFRMGAIRGSSSRRGAAAILELSRHLGGGGDVAITPDGPRGPNYSIAPGILYLSQHAGAAIVPLEVQISSYWRIGKKWDALWIPKPFSKLTMVFHKPLEIMGTPEEESARLDAAMGAK